MNFRDFNEFTQYSVDDGSPSASNCHVDMNPCYYDDRLNCCCAPGIVILLIWMNNIILSLVSWHLSAALPTITLLLLCLLWVSSRHYLLHSMSYYELSSLCSILHLCNIVKYLADGVMLPSLTGLWLTAPALAQRLGVRLVVRPSTTVILIVYPTTRPDLAAPEKGIMGTWMLMVAATHLLMTATLGVWSFPLQLKCDGLALITKSNTYSER